MSLQLSLPRELQSAQMFLLNQRFREERVSPVTFVQGLREGRWAEGGFIITRLELL